LPSPKIFSETVTLEEINTLINFPLPTWNFIEQTAEGQAPVSSHVFGFGPEGMVIRIHNIDAFNAISDPMDRVNRRDWFLSNGFEVQGPSSNEFFAKTIPISELEQETTAEAMHYKYKFYIPSYLQQKFGDEKYYKMHLRNELIFDVAISLTATVSTSDDVQISEEISVSSSGRSVMIQPSYTLGVLTEKTDHNINDGEVRFAIAPSMSGFLHFRAKSCWVECTEGNCEGEKAYIYGYPGQPYCSSEFAEFNVSADGDNELASEYSFKPFKWSSNRGVTYDEKQILHCEVEHALQYEDLPDRNIQTCDE